MRGTSFQSKRLNSNVSKRARAFPFRNIQATLCLLLSSDTYPRGCTGPLVIAIVKSITITRRSSRYVSCETIQPDCRFPVSVASFAPLVVFQHDDGSVGCSWLIRSDSFGFFACSLNVLEFLTRWFCNNLWRFFVTLNSLKIVEWIVLIIPRSFESVLILSRWDWEKNFSEFEDDCSVALNSFSGKLSGFSWENHSFKRIILFSPTISF